MKVKATDLARPEFKANPYAFYARLRAENPVCRTRLMFQPIWLVTRYTDVFNVLNDKRFVKDWLPRTRAMHWVTAPLTSHMLNQDGPDHLRLRTLVHKAFTPALVARLRERIQIVCDELLEKLAASETRDLMSGYALPLPLTIIAELLGTSIEDASLFHKLSRTSLSTTNLIEALLAIPDQRLLTHHLRRLIARRRADPRDDLTTALIQTEEEGDKLNEGELVAMLFLLLIAGYETTVNLISSGALALMQNPEQHKAFAQNQVPAESAVEELLRYTSPLDLSIQRFASEDLTIGSVTIPKGHVVLAVLGSANHDESQFRDPETLDLMREPNRHLAFGQGTHSCIGAPLARLEGQIALTTLFRRFPNLRLSQAAESLRWRKSLIIRGLEELPVTI
jgi:cytochrome P450 PksS